MRDAVLFLDTETASFKGQRPGDQAAPMCQLAAVLRRQDGTEDVLCEVVRPDGWEVKAEAEAVHGISQERCERDGLPVQHLLLGLRELALQCDAVVAHSLEFDLAVLDNEFTLAKVTAPVFARQVCTKVASTPVCRIPGKRGFKWPSLAEAYRILVGGTFEDAHDALADTRACMAVFDKLFPKTKETSVANEAHEYMPGQNWQDDLLESLPDKRQRSLVRYLLRQPEGPVSLAKAYRGKGRSEAALMFEAEAELVTVGLVWWAPADIETDRPTCTLNRPLCEARGRQYGAAMVAADAAKEGAS